MLEKLVHNTEPKGSFYLLVSERNSQIETRFRQVLKLDREKSGKWPWWVLRRNIRFPTSTTPRIT